MHQSDLHSLQAYLTSIYCYRCTVLSAMAALAMAVKEELLALERSKTLPPKKRLSFDASITVAQLTVPFANYISYKSSKDSSHCLFIFVTACLAHFRRENIIFFFGGVYKPWGGLIRYAHASVAHATKGVLAPTPDDRLDEQACWPGL